MARDLIPPPSPAGRPQTPDGTPHLVELPPEPARSGAEPAMASPPPGPSQFRNRFGFLLGALGGVFLAVALLAVIVVADRGGNSDRDFGLAPNWSRWQPSDTSIEGGPAEIANHVAAEYKHPDGKQLVQIKAAVLPDEYDLTVHSSTITDIKGNRLVYTFDGLGPNRQIEGGKPSSTRAKVIHREALELALYTFRYLPDAESITMLLPRRRPPRRRRRPTPSPPRPARRPSRSRCRPCSTARATSSRSCRCRSGRRSAARCPARTPSPGRRPTTSRRSRSPIASSSRRRAT